ncbi:MAG TPA: ABC transporter substrate-binding protein [Chloroflexota bacterium]
MYRHFSSGMLIACGLLLAGCGGGAAPASSAPAQASTAPAEASAKPASSAKPAASAAASAAPAASGPTKITASWSALIPAVLPVWVAYEAGMFKQNGLDVDLQYIESSKGIPAMVSGEVKVADVGGSETMSAVVGGADLVMIGGDAPVWPFILQVPASIKTAEDLRGKKVGVSNFGSSSDIATRVALKHLKLDPDKDVSILAVGSASNRIAAMESGAIQAGVSYPPESLRLEKEGFHTLEDLAAEKLPGNTAATVVPRAFINSSRPTVQKWEDSLVMAIAREKKDKSFTVNVLKKYFKSDDTAAMETSYDYFVNEVIPALPYPTPEQLADAKEVLGAKNDAIKSFDVNKMLDRSFVQSAADRGLDKG